MTSLRVGELGRLGNGHTNIVPYRPFKPSDGEIIIVVGNDDPFKRFCIIAECSGVADDSRFRTNEMRVPNREERSRIIEPIVAARPSAFWLRQLEANNIGCGPINNLERVFSDPQVIARKMVHKMKHSAMGETTVRLLASPIRLSKTPVTYRHAPPLLGQHTAEILSDMLGLDDSEIEELCVLGVVH